ncbi:DUF4199 domain-containing protein [Zunongwangia sp. HGR-M22]|uniref:DUF4199 domain-containing protein n=1 Tax=Zunongwangia sp. HGR-M22 TaxID=3015168 RepID=UPI0022DE45D4|nr:DUF4199 domain-containing protein [Zunongwangia sp. HGR-M22]WBL24883.1 DUF4199 domain-containing protein [Zunongwangia sp. HGR-M22]
MKKFKVEVKWGITFVIAQLIWIAFEKVMGWHDEHINVQGVYSLFFAVIAFLIYYAALKEKRDKYFTNEDFGWQQGFMSGVILTGVITILTPLIQYFAITVISPNYLQNMIAFSEQQGMTVENAETMHSTKMYLFMQIFNALAMGIVTGAIVALITKRKEK